MRAVVAALIPLQVLCAVIGVATDAPRLRVVGSKNLNNFCYVSSVLQALYWIPEVRKHVLQPAEDVQPSKVHMALAQLFADMQYGRDTSVSAELNLWPVMKDMAQAGASMFALGMSDDPDAFLRFLEKHVLSSMPGHVMGLRQQERRLVGLPDGPVFAKPPTDAEETLGVQVCMFDAPQAPVHELLALNTANEMLYTKRDFDDRVYTIHSRQGEVHNGTSEPLTAVLDRIGVEPGAKLASYVKRRLVGPLPAALVISAARFEWDADAQVQPSQPSLATPFAQTFELREYDETGTFPVTPEDLVNAGMWDALQNSAALPEGPHRDVTYALHAVVFRVNYQTHYVAAVCTDASSSAWHLLDDTNVTPLDGPPVHDPQTGAVSVRRAGGAQYDNPEDPMQPYLFVYVREDARSQWVASGAYTSPVQMGPHAVAVRMSMEHGMNIGVAVSEACAMNREALEVYGAMADEIAAAITERPAGGAPPTGAPMTTLQTAPQNIRHGTSTTLSTAPPSAGPAPRGSGQPASNPNSCRPALVLGAEASPIHLQTADRMRDTKRSAPLLHVGNGTPVITAHSDIQDAPSVEYSDPEFVFPAQKKLRRSRGA